MARSNERDINWKQHNRQPDDQDRVRDAGAAARGHHAGGIHALGSLGIVNAPLDKAKLDRGQPDDDCHQYDGLRCRTAEVEADYAVIPDFVHQDLGRLARAPLRDVVDDAESVEEGIDDVDDEPENTGPG